jgi:hypothetical protein
MYILPQNFLAHDAHVSQRLGMLTSLLRIQHQASTRHAQVVAVEELEKRSSRVVALRGITHALEPVFKRDEIRNIEGVGQDGVDGFPGLADRVLDVVDGVGLSFGEDEIGQAGGDVIDRGPEDCALSVWLDLIRKPKCSIGFQ